MNGATLDVAGSDRVSDESLIWDSVVLNARQWVLNIDLRRRNLLIVAKDRSDLLPFVIRLAIVFFRLWHPESSPFRRCCLIGD